MSLSPEARIYDKAPMAPRPAELREGFKLLLDTFGKTTITERAEHSVTSQQLVIQPNLSLNKDLMVFSGINGRQFDVSLVSDVDYPSIKGGITKLGDYPTKYTGYITWIGISEEEYIVLAMSSRNGEMNENEQRLVGGCILGAWEALVTGERRPLDLEE